MLAHRRPTSELIGHFVRQQPFRSQQPLVWPASCQPVKAVRIARSFDRKRAQRPYGKGYALNHRPERQAQFAREDVEILRPGNKRTRIFHQFCDSNQHASVSRAIGLAGATEASAGGSTNTTTGATSPARAIIALSKSSGGTEGSRTVGKTSEGALSSRPR